MSQTHIIGLMVTPSLNNYIHLSPLSEIFEKEMVVTDCDLKIS